MMQYKMVVVEVMMMTPPSRFLLEKQHRQSKNASHFIITKFHQCGHKSPDDDRHNRNNENRHSFVSKVTDYGLGDRVSISCGAWVCIFVTSKKRLKHPAKQSEFRATLRWPDSNAHCTPSLMSMSRMHGIFPPFIGKLEDLDSWCLVQEKTLLLP